MFPLLLLLVSVQSSRCWIFPVYYIWSHNRPLQFCPVQHSSSCSAVVHRGKRDHKEKSSREPSVFYPRIHSGVHKVLHIVYIVFPLIRYWARVEVRDSNVVAMPRRWEVDFDLWIKNEVFSLKTSLYLKPV